MLHKVYVDRSVSEDAVVKRLRLRLNKPFQIIEDSETVYTEVNHSDDPVGAGKQVLFLTRNRGAFIRPCPGTRDYICCDYMILHIGTYCTMDCAYCVLQGYFHPPVLQLFINQDDMTTELQQAFSEKTFRRIGTGEFTDSLIWETWTDMARELVIRFGTQSHMMLELKTKSVFVDNLKGLPHHRRTVVSWSLNTPSMIHANERGTAGLEARIQAAEKCQTWGYPLGFHFDPLILYDGCESEYEGVVNRLFSKIDPDNVVWISLGSFRFPRDLKPLIERRFPTSKIVYGEFVAGMDGKQRYFKPLRIRLYQKLIEYIQRYAPETTIYFCMEDDQVWKQVMGFTPDEKGGLGRILDESAIRVCGLKR